MTWAFRGDLIEVRFGWLGPNHQPEVTHVKLSILNAQVRIIRKQVCCQDCLNKLQMPVVVRMAI